MRPFIAPGNESRIGKFGMTNTSVAHPDPCLFAGSGFFVPDPAIHSYLCMEKSAHFWKFFSKIVKSFLITKWIIDLAGEKAMRHYRYKFNNFEIDCYILLSRIRSKTGPDPQHWLIPGCWSEVVSDQGFFPKVLDPALHITYDKF